MADNFDPYREALVVETLTVWPDGVGPEDGDSRRRIEALLHADPTPVGQLEYLRLPTGFSRKITVTAEDLARLGQAGG